MNSKEKKIIESILKILYSNGFFLYPAVLLLLLCSLILLIFNEVNIQININKIVGIKPLDVFFTYVTFLGDGLFALFIVVVWFFIDRKQAMYLLLSFLFSGLLVFLFKTFVFPESERPVLFFDNNVQHYKLKLIEDVEIFYNNSFPSGHTTTAFALYASLSFISRHREIKLVLFLLAVFVSFSRIYLSEHWLKDVIFGAILGIIVSIVTYFFVFRDKKSYSKS